tara:strand:- start:989 stop:1192 length:204 start_codon:yes stop_codon:yes gene_type:complete
MKKNIKLIIILTIGIIALYFTKVKYEDHSLNKSIMACIIAHKNKSSDIKKEDAEKFCKDEINKNLNK